MEESLAKQSTFVKYSLLKRKHLSLLELVADKHNTLPKSARRHVKLLKFIFGTPRLPDLLCKHHGFASIIMEFLLPSRGRSSVRNVPSGEERGETDVFAGY